MVVEELDRVQALRSELAEEFDPERESGSAVQLVLEVELGQEPVLELEAQPEWVVGLELTQVRDPPWRDRVLR